MATGIAPDSIAKTDGWPVYAKAPDVHYQPHVIGVMAAHVILP